MVDFLNRLVRWIANWRIGREKDPDLTEGQTRAEATFAPPGWMWVTVRNEANEILSEAWEFDEPPTRVESGLAHLTAYVERLTTCEAWYASLTVALDDESGLLLTKMDNEVAIYDSFEGPLCSAQERKARRFFEQEGMPVAEDYLSNHFSSRSLSWALPTDASVVESLTADYLRQIYSATDESALDYKFEVHAEKAENRDDPAGVSFTFVYPIEDPGATPPSAHPGQPQPIRANSSDLQ